MIILGLDPGIGRTGFGVINTNKHNMFVECGCVTTPPSPTPDRLHQLSQDLQRIIKKIKPDHAAVEEVFFGNNRKTAMLTAQARGVLVATLRQHHVTVHSLTPLQIKSQLTGYGQADKQQIQAHVTRRLALTKPPQPDDAADGLAAALCLADRIATTLPLHKKQAYDSVGEP